jgi:uncharacterized protein
MERERIAWISLRARGLAVLRGVVESSGVREFLSLLDLLSEESPDPTAVAASYGRSWEKLARGRERLSPDAWRSYLLGRTLDDENPFSLGAERGEIGPEILEQTRRDLRTLQALFELDAETVLRAVEAAVPTLAGAWVPWRCPEPAGPAGPVGSAGGHSRRSVARGLADAADWGTCVRLLADHFARHGTGPFGRYRAFRWAGTLRPVAHPDPVRLSGLVGYGREREPLVENTERFLAGLPAHHALLYGLPGTGKSSTVKAILNEYADAGLRLVELSKGDLESLPRVLEVLRGRAPRFVLFVDDLSFEEHEVAYKSLKALLEGSVDEPPENVRLYATSNRRNLIRERFSERDERDPTGGAGDDVHARDTMQEKLSLAARFGLRVTFPVPDQRRYLEIVAGLVSERGIRIPEAELAEKALLWDRWHAGRSGRTARQFVDELEAELARP